MRSKFKSGLRNFVAAVFVLGALQACQTTSGGISKNTKSASTIKSALVIPRYQGVITKIKVPITLQFKPVGKFQVVVDLKKQVATNFPSTTTENDVVTTKQAHLSYTEQETFQGSIKVSAKNNDIYYQTIFDTVTQNSSAKLNGQPMNTKDAGSVIGGEKPALILEYTRNSLDKNSYKSIHWDSELLKETPAENYRFESQKFTHILDYALGEILEGVTVEQGSTIELLPEKIITNIAGNTKSNVTHKGKVKLTILGMTKLDGALHLVSELTAKPSFSTPHSKGSGHLAGYLLINIKTGMATRWKINSNYHWQFVLTQRINEMKEEESGNILSVIETSL